MMKNFYPKGLNMLKATLLLSLLIFASHSYAQKQEISFDKLTVEAGLSQSSVFSITQDSLGFMWFGTKDGLNRYDSQQFEVFRNQSNDSTSLSSSQNINALLTDSKGNLWVGTQEGLNKYIPETKSFIRFLNHPTNNNSLSNNTVRCIYEDLNGNVWIGTENGLNKFLGDGKFERFFCKGANGYGLVSPIIKAIHQDSRNTLWVGTQGGLVNLAFKNGLYKYKTYFHHNDNINSLSSNDINAITEDLNHNIWIGSHFDGLNLLNRADGSFKHLTASSSGLSSNIIRKILIDKEGLLWIATFNGISIYDPVNQVFNNQFYDPENASSLNHNSIYDIYQDAVGSIWVGTYYGGINVYHPNAVPFKIYKHYSYKNSLSSNVISAMVEDKFGNLWIGTEAEGLNYFDRNSGKFKNYKNGEHTNSISSNLIKAISIDKNDNLWIAAYEGGVDYYNIQKGQFKNYKVLNQNSLSEKRVTYVLADEMDRIWAGTKGKGLYLFDKEKDGFTTLRKYGSNFYLPSKNITCLFKDSKNTLWVAADDGVFYLPKKGNRFYKLHAPKSSFLNHVNVIAQKNNGEILLGSYNEGMATYKPSTHKLVFFTTHNGLPSNSITGIIEDNEQRIWVSTDKGIAKIGRNGVKIYNRSDGLPGNVFNYHSVLKDGKGKLYFGGYNGLVSFYPEDILENKTPPKMVFTRLRLFNKEVSINDQTQILPKSLNKIEALVFSYQQNVFSIDFSALNFVKAKKNRYAYKLEGFEKSWNYTDKPTATFTNLPDGNYSLLIKGTNNDGIWNQEATSLKIVVTPPIWRTWYAYLFYILALGGLFYLGMRFLLIRALLKREHDVHQMKLEFFTNVSHEIRTPLTLILGPLEKMIEDTKQDFSINRQLQAVNRNAKRLMRLINELMDFRKIESGKMKLKIVPDNVVTFVHEIYLSFQQLAVQKNIDFSFIAQEKEIEVYFDKDQLEKVIFNLLSNAIKFAPQKSGKIAVEITKQEEYVFIRVKDNGEGIPQESRSKLFTDFYQVSSHHQQRNLGSGIGLALSKSIAKLHHGNLMLEENSEMTTFCLSLKTGNNQYRADEINDSFNIDDRGLYELQTEIDSIIYHENKKKTSISEILPLLLIVDDNEEVRNFIVQALSPYYQVISATNGEDGLAIALDKIPDVIISDVMMPVMDGFEFCNKIKSDLRTRHIPVVLLTARSGDLHEIDGLKNGADIYLTKPFGTQKLHLIIENLLSLHENMRAKFSQQFSLEPSEVQIESSDEEFLHKVLQLLENNISNTEFNVNLFASEVGMSTPVFYKKIYALTGLTVNNFCKSIRLKRASQLLQQKAGNISEIAYMVGFNDAKYFSKEFKKQFGKNPSEYIQ